MKKIHVIYCFFIPLLGCIKEVENNFNYKNRIVVSAKVCSDCRYNLFYLQNNFSLSDTISTKFNTLEDATIFISDDLGNSHSITYNSFQSYENDSLLFKFNEGRIYSIVITTPDGRKASSSMKIPTGVSANTIGFDTSFTSYSGGEVGSIKRNIGLSLSFQGSDLYNHSYAQVYYSTYYKTASNFDTTVSSYSFFDFDQKATQYLQYATVSTNASLYFQNDSAVFLRMDIDSIYYHLETEDEIYPKYTKSLQLQKSLSDDPFAEPALLNSNIKDGLGVFCGYARRTKKIKFK